MVGIILSLHLKARSGSMECYRFIVNKCPASKTDESHVLLGGFFSINKWSRLCWRRIERLTLKTLMESYA
jgi:hypothetical protein